MTAHASSAVFRPGEGAPMTAAEWISDVVEAAATLGYRVEAIDWSASSVTIAPNGTYDRDAITIRSLFLSGAYLLSRIRPIVEATPR